MFPSFQTHVLRTQEFKINKVVSEALIKHHFLAVHYYLIWYEMTTIGVPILFR